MTRCTVARAAVVSAVLFLGIQAPAGATESQPTEARRIVSLVPAITETLFALGMGPSVVGVSTYCDHPPQTKTLPKVGSFTEPVAETIVALRPDLVLTSPSPGNETAVRAIERTGVRVAVVQSEGGLKEARTAILEVARAVGVAGEGERLLRELDARLDSIRAAAASRERPLAAIVVGREPLVLAGPGSYLGELLELAGGRNVAQDLGGRWPRVGMEFLIASGPEVLVDLSMSMAETPAETPGGTPGAGDAGAWSSMPSLPAVANGRVVRDADSVMLRPGPRLGDAAAALFRALHPDVVLAPGAAAATEGN